MYGIGGQIVYTTDPYGTQLRTDERQFFIKLDSSCNIIREETFQLFRDYNPYHLVKTMHEFTDGGVVIESDSVDALNTYTLRKFGPITNEWSEYLDYIPNGGMSIQSSFMINDTLYYTGAYSYYNPVNSRGFFWMALDINGDTIFYKEYPFPGYLFSSLNQLQSMGLRLIANYSSSFSFYGLDPANDLVLIDSVYGLNNVDKIISLNDSLFAVTTWTNDSILYIISDSGNSVDTIAYDFSFFSIEPRIGGGLLALATSKRGMGSYLLILDNAGNIISGIRPGSFVPSDIQEIDDSTFICTGHENDVIFFEKFKIPAQQRHLQATSTILCSNDSIELTAPPGMTYSWPDGSVSQSIFVHTPGNYYCTLIDVVSNITVSDTIYITNNSGQIELGNDTVVCNNSIVLLDAGNGFSSYLWNDGSTSQYFSDSTMLLANDTVSYFVLCTDSLGCSSFDTIVYVFDICQSIISESVFPLFEIYPNPVSGRTTLLIKTDNLSGSIVITSIEGKEIFSSDKFVSNEVLLPELRSGMYFVNLIEKGRVTTRNLIVN